MPALPTLRMYGRFVLGLPWFLRRERVTVDEAKASVRRDLAARDTSFLTLVRRGIFDHPRSPYLPLLKLAGCQLGDIESMVRREGLEATLEELRRAGVYFTFEEYKGRRPVVRGGLTINVDEHDFDNPLTRKALEGRTSGSTGASTRVSTDLDDIEAQIPILMLVRWGHGLLGIPSALWKGAPPDPVGLGVYLRAARTSHRAGTGTALEVRKAEEALDQAELAEIKAYFDAALARAALLLAQGVAVRK